MMQALRLLGQQARWALPMGVFLGILWPELAHAARPLLNLAVVGTLTAALLRLDWDRLGQAFAAPRLPLLLSTWQLLLSPVLVFALVKALRFPDVYVLILVLQAAAPPIGSASAFAMFLGLDGSLAMVGAAWMTLLLPLSLTAVVAWLLPQFGIEVDVLAFFVRVSLFALSPFVLAWLVRRSLGVQRLRQEDAALAGVNVVMLVIFAVAVMDGVTAAFWARPLEIGTLLFAACAGGVFWHLVGYALFKRQGLQVAYTAALLNGNRNMGLMLAVTVGTAGEAFALYVGIAQIPMYFAPLLLGPFVRRSSLSSSHT